MSGSFDRHGEVTAARMPGGWKLVPMLRPARKFDRRFTHSRCVTHEYRIVSIALRLAVGEALRGGIPLRSDRMLDREVDECGGRIAYGRRKRNVRCNPYCCKHRQACPWVGEGTHECGGGAEAFGV